MMQISSDIDGLTDDIVALFKSSFTASEGKAEGQQIETLARELLEETPPKDMRVYITLKDQEVVGCIIFTRLFLDEDITTVFLLSPVAVATDHQNQGVGQSLLRHGLKDMRARDVDVIATYGDPSYYSKVGFKQIDESILEAPFALEQPEGWMAQSLTGDALTPIKSTSRAVAALHDPQYW